MLDDLLLAYHDLKDLYDDDVESSIETIDDVESIKTIDYTSNSSSNSSSTSIKKKQKCNTSDHHHRIHLQRQQPPGKWRDDLTDENNDNHDDDDDDDNSDSDNDNDRDYDDEWKPTSSNNKISIKKKKKKTSTMTTPKKRHRRHNNDGNKVKVKTGKGETSSWIRSSSSSSISRSRSKKRLDHASLKNLMIGLESPSLFSPRAIMLKNEVFLDSLVDVDVDVGGVTSVENPTTPQKFPSYPDITTVIVEKKIHNNDKNKNKNDDEQLDHDLEEEEEELLLMAGKRIEVQWDMNDGTTDWFAGTIRSISNDRSEAVLLYDDGDCCLVDMNDDDMEWRCCCQQVVVVAPAAAVEAPVIAAPAAMDTMIESKTAPRESSFLSPPSTVLSGMDVPISPIVVKKKKKEKQPSSSSLLSSLSSSSLPLRDTTMTVKGVGGEASSTLKSDTRKVKITESRKLPRTCGVLYSRDKKGGFYCVDGCEGDLGYGVHSVPGGRVKNSEVYSNYVDSQKEPNQESRERKSSSLPLRDTTMTVILNKQKPKEKQNGERRRRKVPDLFVAETSQDHNSRKNKNKYGNHNNIINSNFPYKERTRTRIGNDDDNDDGDHRDHRRDHRDCSNILKNLQPFNQPGKNQTYNVTGLDYKNEKAALGRGRKRRNFESDNNQEQDQQKQKQTIPRLELKQVQNETTLVVVIKKKKKKKRKRTQPPAFAHITTGRRLLPPPIKIPKAKGIAYLTYDRPLVANEEIML